jgi:uncharacterized protein involved in high-affinity Fe2+ transport
VRRVLAATLCIAAIGFGSVALSKEYPIGKPQQVAGMEVAAAFVRQDR